MTTQAPTSVPGLEVGASATTFTGGVNLPNRERRNTTIRMSTLHWARI